jgi:hypothetical protein
MKKKKNYVLTAEKAVDGGTATILVYGELWEDSFVDGIRIQRVGLSRDGRRIIEHGAEVLGSLGMPYARTKFFNFGWAICAPGDKYSEEIGVRLAKKRFSVSPLSTQSGNLLTDDMNLSILQNELDFISDNFDKFYKRTEEPDAEEIVLQPNDIITIAPATNSNFKEDIHFGCIEKVNEDRSVVLKWDIQIMKLKDGTLLRKWNEGQHTLLKYNEEKPNFWLSTQDEINALKKYFEEFGTTILPS